MAAVSVRAKTDLNGMFQQAVDTAIRKNGEIGLQVAVYLDGEQVVDVWGGLADETTGREVDGDTLFPVFSVVKAVTATALHIQAERGLIDYHERIARYWPEFAAHGKDQATVRDALSHRLGISHMPEGVTPELMCDYEWMVQQLADMKPYFAPGTKNAYMRYIFGWIIAECVRRTDPKKRPFGRFVQEELCAPLGITDLWIGIPDEAEPRVAKLTNAPELPRPADPLFLKGIPPQVGCVEEVWGRHDVRRACIPGAGGTFTARSTARFFALLANGGELNGVRLLSEERVRSFSVLRPESDQPDLVLGWPVRVGTAGFWLGGERPAPPACVGRNPHTLCHPGAGGSIGWADPDARLAVAICHNRMFNGPDNPFKPIEEAVGQAFGVA